MNNGEIRGGDQFETHLAEGNRCRSLGEYGPAESAYLDAMACLGNCGDRLRREQAAAEIALALADMYCLRNEPGKAIEYYGKLLEPDPRKPEILRNLGRCYRALGDDTRAGKVFADALACLDALGERPRREQVAGEIRLELGDICAGRSAFAQAIEHYGKVRDLDPRKPEIHRNLGRCYRNLGDYGSAAKAYEDARACLEHIGDPLRREQATAEINLELGYIYHLQAAFAEAAACYGRILAIDAGQPEIQLILGRCRRAMGETAGAEKAYREALACIGRIGDQARRDRIAGEIHLELGDICCARTDYAVAIEWYEKILAADAVRPEVRRNIGWCYRNLGQYGPAEKAYNEALALAAECGDEARRALAAVEINRELADMYGRRSEYGKSIGCYERLLALGADDAQTRLNLGQSCLMMGDAGRAERELGIALARAENRGGEKEKRIAVEANLELADLHAARFEFEKAAARYEQALACGGDDPEIRRRLGRCFRHLGDRDRAGREFAAARALLEDREQTDGGVRTLLQLAAVHRELGNHAVALECLSRAKTVDASSVDVDIAFAEVYLMQQEYSRAIKLFENVLGRSPDAVHVYSALGYACKGIGDDKRALECFNRVRESCKYDVDLIVNMGEIYLRQGDYDRGMELLRGYLCGASVDSEVRVKLYLLLARFHYARGERSEAAALLRKYLETSDDGNVFLSNRLLNIAEYLEGATVMKSRPTSLMVTVTSRCNLHCLMCGIGDRTFDMPEKTLREIKELFPYLEHVTWLGGEVFMSKDFEELFDISLTYRNIGIREVVTNALLLTGPVIEKFVKHGVVLTISIDGVTGPTYERIRRGGRFETLLRNLEIIAGYRGRYGQTESNTLHMNFVVMKSNYREIELIPEFCRRHGFTCVNLMRLNPNPGLEEESIENDPAAQEYLRTVMPRIVAELGALKIAAGLDRFFGDLEVGGRQAEPAGGAEARAADAGGPAAQENAAPVRTEPPDRPAAQVATAGKETGMSQPAARGNDSPGEGCRACGREEETADPRCGCAPQDIGGAAKNAPYVFDAYFSYCRAPWKGLVLQSDRFAYPDCDCLFPAGDFTRQSLDEIWNSEMMQRYRRALTNKTDRDICSRQCLIRKNLSRDAGTISL